MSVGISDHYVIDTIRRFNTDFDYLFPPDMVIETKQI